MHPLYGLYTKAVTTIFLAVLFGTEVTAEFWGRTVPLKNDEGQMKAVASESHLVVEAKVLAAKGQPVRVTPQQFRLRINGAKLPIPTDSPGMAAAAIQYPDWDSNRGLEAQAGPVIVGRRQPTPRFPGDPAERNRGNSSDKEDAVRRSLPEAVAAASWHDGDVVTERSGLLFFGWKGKVAKIKTLELIWQGVDGVEQVVKLR